MSASIGPVESDRPAHEQLLTVAELYRHRAASIPEEAVRLKYDPAPFIREVEEKAALYEACARDVEHLPEDQAAVIARRFRVAMWLRDENPDYEPDDFHP